MASSPGAIARRMCLPLAAALLAAGAFAGCGGSSNNSATSADGASGGTVQFLDLPYGDHTVASYKAAADAFKAQTGTSVDVSQVSWDAAHAKFLSLISANQAPDIAVFGPKWLPEFIDLNVLQPLDDLFPKSFFANFPKALLDQVTVDGHIWALPEGLSTRLMYYRTDLLKKAGIAAPPKTWTEFVADAKKLNNPPSNYGFCVQGQGDETIWNYTYFLYGAGGRYTDSANNWAVNQPANVKALQMMVDLSNTDNVTQPKPTGTGLDTAQELLVKGNCAMYFGPPWILAQMKSENPALMKDIQVTDYPTESGKPAPLFIQDVFVMFKNAKNPKAAAKFLQFWSQDKYQEQFNESESLIPVTKSAGAAPYFKNNKAIQRFVQSIPESISYPVKNGWDTVNTEVSKAIQAAYLGESPQTALDKANEAIARQVKSG
jgi:multiple sugar transport system substrate-binding protein